MAWAGRLRCAIRTDLLRGLLVDSELDERIASPQSILGAVCSRVVAHGSSYQPVVHQLSGLVCARGGEFQGVLRVGIALSTGAILSTALISRPIHAQLDIQGNTPELVSRLIATDWIRNVPEWGRTALYVWALSRLIAPGPSGIPAT